MDKTKEIELWYLYGHKTARSDLIPCRKKAIHSSGFFIMEDRHIKQNRIEDTNEIRLTSVQRKRGRIRLASVQKRMEEFEGEAVFYRDGTYGQDSCEFQ